MLCGRPLLKRNGIQIDNGKDSYGLEAPAHEVLDAKAFAKAIECSLTVSAVACASIPKLLAELEILESNVAILPPEPAKELQALLDSEDCHFVTLTFICMWRQPDAEQK